MDQDNWDEKYAPENLDEEDEEDLDQEDEEDNVNGQQGIDISLARQVVYINNVAMVETKSLAPFILNELNYQYFYRINNPVNNYFTDANGDYQYRYQAVGSQVDNRLPETLFPLMNRQDHAYKIVEYGLMYELLQRQDYLPPNPSFSGVSFLPNNVMTITPLTLVDKIDMFYQHVYKQYFPRFPESDKQLQFNHYATQQLKKMCMDIQQQYGIFSESYYSDPIPVIEQYDDAIIDAVLPRWLESNSFYIYNHDNTKKIRLMCPFFSYKSTMHTNPLRSYCVFKFLEWNDDKGEICPYMYTIEVDPVRDLIQKLPVIIEGELYYLYVRLVDPTFDSSLFADQQVWEYSHITSNPYYRMVNPNFMFSHGELPLRIMFYDPVKQETVVFTDFSLRGDCFPIAMTTCMLTMQPDMFRYVNLFRCNQYQIDVNDGYVHDNSFVKRGFYTRSDYDILTLFSNRLQYSYPITPSSTIYTTLGEEHKPSDKFPLVPDRFGNVNDMDDVLYWSPQIILANDYYAATVDSNPVDWPMIGRFLSNNVYDFEEVNIPNKNQLQRYALTRGFRSITDSPKEQEDYLYQMLDYLGCDTDGDTHYPISVPGHITTLTHVRNEDGTRQYLIIEPQTGNLYEAYDYLIRGNNIYYDAGSTQYRNYFRLALTRTCRKVNHIKSLASPLVMWAAIDPMCYKGNLLPIYEQGISTAYMILRTVDDTSTVGVRSIIRSEDYSIDIKTMNGIITYNHGLSYKLLKEEFLEFLIDYASLSVFDAINKLMMLPREDTINSYIILARTIFSWQDPYYNPSEQVSYLSSLYHQIDALYTSMFHGLKVLYVDQAPFEDARFNLNSIQAFMNFLLYVRDNLTTIEIYATVSTPAVYEKYKDYLTNDVVSKEMALNFLYAKPVFRTVVKYELDHVPHSTSPSFSVGEPVAELLSTKPVLNYKALYNTQLNPNTGKVLVLLRKMFKAENKRTLNDFIQMANKVYDVLSLAHPIIEDTLPSVLLLLFNIIVAEFPADYPEPIASDVEKLFPYFIFMVNLYRFRSFSLIIGKYA
jgi:hypothetical protein